MRKNHLKSYDIPLIHRAAKILQENPTKPFTTTSLALEVCINPFKLKNGFRQFYHQTIYQFRLELKLNLVKQLLRDTDLTIAEIAYKTGFDSRDSLARCFRNKFNLCPREWRKQQSQVSEPRATLTIAHLRQPCAGGSYG